MLTVAPIILCAPPPKFNFAWEDNWESIRTWKETMLVWQLWHKVVAVNA
jgi:hypothetical protein